MSKTPWIMKGGATLEELFQGGAEDSSKTIVNDDELTSLLGTSGYDQENFSVTFR